MCSKTSANNCNSCIKYKRAWFGDKEMHTLVDIIGKYRIVESKKSDASTCSAKNEAWKGITEEYNKLSLEKRTVEQLKTKFDNLKRETRKFFNTKVNEPAFSYNNDISIERRNLETDTNKTIKKNFIIGSESINQSNSDFVKFITLPPNQEMIVEDPLKFEASPTRNIQEESIDSELLHGNENDKGTKHNFTEEKSRILKLKEESMRRKRDRENEIHDLVIRKEEELYDAKIEGLKLTNERKRLKIELLKRELNKHSI